MNNRTRKIVSMTMLAAGIFGICSAEGCPEDTRQGDKAAVVVCQTKGYKKASFKDQLKKGTFMVCGGDRCEVRINYPDKGKGANRSSDVHTIGRYKEQKTFTVPQNAKNWFAKHCGKIYKKIPKRA